MNAWVRTFLTGIGMMLAISGCAGGVKPLAAGSHAQAVGTTMPVPTPSDYTRAIRDYHVGPSDKIKIDVFGVPELQREIQVDGAGRFAFPLIGIIEAAGRTPGEISDDVARRLRAGFVRDPQVTVNLVESTTQTVTVDGSVQRPGMYPVLGRMTLQRAIAVAGGTAELANLEDVVIQREINSQTYVGLFNLGDIRRGNYADPEVFPSDLVIVGESRQRRLFRDLIQAAPLASTPLILLLGGGGS